MVKKRLADLLRQEAEKFPETEGETVEETGADEPLDEVRAVEVSPAPSVHSDAHLEATVAQLRAALEQSQQKEASLQQQIGKLQSDFTAQKKLVHKLEVEVDKANQKAELEEAKKTILELVETNNKLIEEVATLKKDKKEKEDIKAPEPRKTKLKSQSVPQFSHQHTEEPTDFAVNSWLLD